MTFKQHIHLFLGKLLGKKYRLWYHRTHSNTYLWGIILMLHDLPPPKEGIIGYLEEYDPEKKITENKDQTKFLTIEKFEEWQRRISEYYNQQDNDNKEK